MKCYRCRRKLNIEVINGLCINCLSRSLEKILIAKQTKDNYKRFWKKALDNMPYMAAYSSNKDLLYLNINGMTVTRTKIFRGKPTALRICLGYQCYTANGRSNAQTTCYQAMRQGSKPRSKARQRLLQALAGPHGATLARARLIQLNQASRFKHWPKDEINGEKTS